MTENFTRSKCRVVDLSFNWCNYDTTLAHRAQWSLWKIGRMIVRARGNFAVRLCLLQMSEKPHPWIHTNMASYTIYFDHILPSVFPSDSCKLPSPMFTSSSSEIHVSFCCWGQLVLHAHTHGYRPIQWSKAMPQKKMDSASPSTHQLPTAPQLKKDRALWASSSFMWEFLI